MKMLENKVAIITGASRGIGKQIAYAFAEQGCAIAFTYLNSEDAATVVQNDIEAMGVSCKAYQFDAADFEAVHQMVSQVQQDFGHIDILVNNAGVTRDTLMLRMSEEQWDYVLDKNLKSAFNFMHAVAPVMLKQHSGSIISMSSVVGLHGNAGQANYAASKAGIVALTQSMAQELGSRGVRVNAIAPGFIQTDMTAQLKDEALQRIIDRIPMRRAGSPAEVAEVAVFLASDMSSYVSGQVIQVDGAMC